MTIKELQERKKRTEASLGKEIGKHLASFTQETGVDVNSVFIELLDVRTFGDARPRYVLGSVRWGLVV